MESIYSLIKCLNKSEYETIRNFYTVQLSENRDVEKTLSLLDFIRKSSEEPTKEQCMRVVYGKMEDSSFRQLKSRLTHRILDTVITEVNLDKIDMLEQFDIISIKLRKKFTQVLYLYSTKGNIPVVYEILNSIIKSAEEYCIYNVLMEALRLKKMLISIRGSDAEITEIEAKRDYYGRCDQARTKASGYYFELIRKVSHKASESKQAYQNLLISAINDLKDLFEELKAPSVGYYLKVLEMAYFENCGDYNTAKDTCHEQIELLKSKELYRKERVGMAYDQIGHYEILSGNYLDAIEYFEKAQNYFKKNSINLIVSKEQEFLAMMYCSRLEQAEEIIDEILNHNVQDQGAFRLSKFRFYKAALLFRKEEYAASNKVISQNLEISNDKGGWDIATRFLMILSNIELEDYDQASLQIQSLKRHLERTKKKEHVSERDLLIFKTLQAIDKQGYQWSMLGPSFLEVLKNLGDDSGPHAWKPLGPEIIRFDDWLRDRVGKRKVNKWETTAELVNPKRMYRKYDKTTDFEG